MKRIGGRRCTDEDIFQSLWFFLPRGLWAPLPEANLTFEHVLRSGQRCQAGKSTSAQYIITWIWIIWGDPSDCTCALLVDPINFKLRALIYLQMAALLWGGGDQLIMSGCSFTNTSSLYSFLNYFIFIPQSSPNPPAFPCHCHLSANVTHSRNNNHLLD